MFSKDKAVLQLGGTVEQRLYFFLSSSTPMKKKPIAYVSYPKASVWVSEWDILNMLTSARPLRIYPQWTKNFANWHIYIYISQSQECEGVSEIF